METSNLSNPDYQFEIGDVVSLKSGGGNMTISYRYRGGAIPQYEVRWLDNGGHMQKDLVPEKVIRPASTFEFLPSPVPYMPLISTPNYQYPTTIGSGANRSSVGGSNSTEIRTMPLTTEVRD